MKRQFLISLAVGIVAASSVIGAGVAAERSLPAPKLGILGADIPNTDALPPPKYCEVGKGQDRCIKGFMAACHSAGGTVNAIGNSQSGESLTCTSQ